MGKFCQGRLTIASLWVPLLQQRPRPAAVGGVVGSSVVDTDRGRLVINLNSCRRLR